jgi:hypothetical protein
MSQRFCAFAVEGCLSSLFGQLLDTQEEGRPARSRENVTLMPELFCFSACRFGKQDDAAAPSQLFPTEPSCLYQKLKHGDSSDEVRPG